MTVSNICILLAIIVYLVGMLRTFISAAANWAPLSPP